MQNILLPHEHLAIDLSTVKQNPDCKMDNSEQIILELNQLKKLGVSTIVDATNIGMGRNVKTLRRISAATGIRILSSTGFYQQKFYFDLVKNKTIEQLVAIMEKEILVGIDNTNIKADLVGEIGTSWNTITEEEQKVLTAAAIVAQKHQRVLLTHLSLGTMGREQLIILQQQKMNLSKVIFSHIELANDLDYILEILASGVNIGIDTVGKLEYLSDEVRIEMIKTIINKGYINQLVLSRDISRKSYMKLNGGLGWEYLLTTFYQKMLNHGISERDLAIIFKNANRIYEIT